MLLLLCDGEAELVVTAVAVEEVVEWRLDENERWTSLCGSDDE